jgi:hypothetical protein
MYDLMYEVTTRELLEEGTPDDVVMEVEGHEDGFIAKILAPVGTAAAPDQPMCASGRKASLRCKPLPPAAPPPPCDALAS